MINEIQKLIKQAEAQKNLYDKQAEDAEDQYAEGYYNGLSDGRDFLIRELTLLLNTEREEDR